MFSFNLLIMICTERQTERGRGRRGGEEGCLKLDVQGQWRGRIFDVDGQVGWRVLKIGQFSGTSYVYHVVRMPTERCQKQLLFNKHKYHS